MGTTNGLLPYPEDTAPLADMALAIKDLATALDPARAKMARNTVLSVPNSSFTKVGGYTSTPYQKGVTVSASAGTMTIVAAGTYAVSASAGFSSNSTGRRIVQIVRGTTPGSNEVIVREEVAPAGYVTLSVATDVICKAGDVISMEAYQSSGSALDLRGDFTDLFLTVRRVGPGA